MRKTEVDRKAGEYTKDAGDGQNPADDVRGFCGYDAAVSAERLFTAGQAG
jgi:hypothetical protein